MAKSVPTQTELFDVAELPGRPMLHWHGKRPLREIPYYPAQLRERYGSFLPFPREMGELEGGGVPRRITDTPSRRDEMVQGEYSWEPEEYGEGQVALKIVDVLDEEWFEMVEE